MPKESFGIIGVGAFGEFIIPHLAPHGDIVLYDGKKDVGALAKKYQVTAGDLGKAASCDTVILAMPVQQIESVLKEIAPLVKPGTLVMDVGSVKIKPTEAMKKLLPAHIDIVGTHPLFGPQSGKNGIEGLNIAICNIRGARAESLGRFCADKLKLKVFHVTPEEHDRQLAYVQSLTHLIGKVVVSLNLPEFTLKTRTYELMSEMVEMIRYDSDELFRAIERENIFTAEAKEAFFNAARKLEEKLAKD